MGWWFATGALNILAVAGWLALPALVTSGVRAPEGLVPLEAVAPPMRDSVAAVLHDPDLRFVRERIGYACRVTILERLLDALPLAADIWDAYQFKPRYIVTPLGPARYTVTDRTWLEGHLQLLYNRDGIRLYYARGIARLQGVPGVSMTLHGTTVVVMRYTGHDSSMVGNVYTYSRLDRGLTEGIARAALPVLGTFIEARIDDAIRKGRTITEDVARVPEQVLAKLQQRRESATEPFRRLFLLPGSR